MNEEWVNVKIFKNNELLTLPDYKIEKISLRIKSFKRNKNGIILKPRCTSNGYPFLYLVYNQVPLRCMMHRVVASTFIHNPENLPYINHKNGVTKDYSINNLEWCTRAYNVQHAFDELGRKPPEGENNPRSKLTSNQVKEICTLLDDGELSHRQIGDIFNVSDATIDMINSGKRWAHLTKRA